MSNTEKEIFENWQLNLNHPTVNVIVTTVVVNQLSKTNAKRPPCVSIVAASSKIKTGFGLRTVPM
jgi:hypothetical protein